MSQNVTLPAMISAVLLWRAGIETIASKERRCMGRPRTQDLGCLDRSRAGNPRRTTHVEFRSLAWLCAAVDRRWKKALEVPLSAIFPDVSLNDQVPELDQQVVLCEADQAGN